MRRSESRLDDDSPVSGFIRDGLAAAGSAMARNPVAVGGTTAFLVTFFYVSANAIWNQPGVHAGAFFSTREPVTAMRILREEPAPAIRTVEPPSPQAQRLADPVVQRVQDLLRGAGLYTGTVDGLTGPQTRRAIEAYQSAFGMEPTGNIDDRLIDHLTRRTPPDITNAVPAPAPRPRVEASAPAPAPAEAPRPAVATAETVARVQAGLRAFGNDDVEIDGLMGQKTRAAIREFQQLFGLPVTGEVDAVLVTKMSEIGLTN